MIMLLCAYYGRCLWVLWGLWGVWVLRGLWDLGDLGAPFRARLRTHVISICIMRTLLSDSTQSDAVGRLPPWASARKHQMKLKLNPNGTKIDWKQRETSGGN